MYKDVEKRFNEPVSAENFTKFVQTEAYLKGQVESWNFLLSFSDTFFQEVNASAQS